MKVIGVKYLVVVVVCLLLAGVAVAQFLPRAALTPAASCDSIGSNAFVGCYYSGTDFSTLKGIRTDPAINFNWGSGSPDPSLSGDNFSVKWEGDFTFSTAGTYRFTATADDGIRLYVDNAILLDEWFDQPSSTYAADLSLAAGDHRIRVEYYEHGGGAVAEVSCLQVDLPAADSPKGGWGKVTPIADDRHPNLYYNQSEIDELRNMILVQHEPRNLYDLYTTQIRDVVAEPTTEAQNVYGTYSTDMRAAISYMIEPTSAKADAIHTALFSFVARYPVGLSDWSNSSSFSGYALPWMFDLLMAYHREKLTQLEIVTLKAWFKLSSETCCHYVAGREPGAAVYDGEKQALIQEGPKTVQAMANWWSRFLGPSLAAALVSGNQEAVDFWADSGWPHNLFTTESVTATYPLPGTNRFDLVMYLLSVLPSGANTDTYQREGYNLGRNDWFTTDYTLGIYHFAQMYGAIAGAEMAFHNGMTGVFDITDSPETEPALVRTYKRAIASRNELDTQPVNPTGHPIVGFDPVIFAGYRRYSDPVIEGAIPGILSYNGPIPSGVGGPYRGYDIPGDIWQFFGYPRRIVWTADSVNPTAPKVKTVVLSNATVAIGGTYYVDFSGANLEGPIFFDVRFRGPGSNDDQEVPNWQVGASGAHNVTVGTPIGIWTITGVRPHRNLNDHSGAFTSTSASLTVPIF